MGTYLTLYLFLDDGIKDCAGADTTADAIIADPAVEHIVATPQHVPSPPTVWPSAADSSLVTSCPHRGETVAFQRKATHEAAFAFPDRILYITHIAQAMHLSANVLAML